MRASTASERKPRYAPHSKRFASFIAALTNSHHGVPLKALSRTRGSQEDFGCSSAAGY
jgi:hypothetical protein